MKVSKYDIELECLNCSLPFCNRRLWDCLLNPRQRPQTDRVAKNREYYANYLAKNNRSEYWKKRYQEKKNEAIPRSISEAMRDVES